MTITEAAKILNNNPQTLRLALQQNLLPFGIAVKTSENRYTYKIFETRLERYLEGVDYETKSGSLDTDNWNRNGYSNVGVHS